MKRIFLAVFTLALFLSSAASADLSARSAFTLIQKVPPGELIEDAAKFLGRHAFERSIPNSEGIKIRRWGTQNDSWLLEVLHDGETVRATRVTWVTKARRDQQIIFSQLTTAGKNFFGKSGKFKGLTEAEWSDFGGRWIVRATMGENGEGVFLLSGIRDAIMDSGKYGF
ncbi:MAG: hypothetical protein LBQ58_11775 [Synergistaceae bacterium]|jgi:hypothetical protein|nr:hypothetical protein [Synergistaceae bacterium]